MRFLRRVFALSLLSAGPLAAQEHVHPAGDPASVGHVRFPVSCAPAVRAQFEQAVAMLHSFWFEAANDAFSDIARRDSTCALAYWGQAMTLMGNPMTRISPNAERLQRGLALSERAVALAANASHREQMYAAAVLAYYRDHTSRDHLARMKAHEQAFEAIRSMHGDDIEATIFYARTVVANASPTDKTYADQLRAASLMQPLFDANPQHPGLAHYIIHAYDAPAIAEKGEAAARAYAGIAPDAPHALHMPSHIFTRIGRWDESIETNQRSARAEPDSNAAVHPMDYMVYAYLQQGRVRDARAVVGRATSRIDQFYGRVMGYNYTAMRARFALERNAWDEAAALTPGANEADYVRALTHFARALGAARSGKAAAARADLDALEGIVERLRQSDAYWATVVGAQTLAAAAWATFPTNRDEAIAMARRAAELEETVEKHPVTPGPLIPARELLADMLFEAGRFAEARAEYERTLVNDPRRLRALAGAAGASRRAGDDAGARAHYSTLLEVASRGDADHPHVMAARAFLR